LVRGFASGRRPFRLAGEANFRSPARPRYTNCAKHLFCFAKRWVTPFAKREMQPGQDRETPVTEPDNSGMTRPAAGLPGWAVSILRAAVVSLALGIIFAWFGVYQTSSFPFPERVAYWTLLMGVGVASSALVTPLVFERWLRDAHPALPIAVTALLISIPITLGLVLFETAVEGAIPDPTFWWLQYFYVIVLSAILTAGAWGVDKLRTGGLGKPASTPTAPLTDPGPAVPAFADRLPVKFRAAEIHAVSAEDHYLRVHTSAGETMILLRLADAIRELAALPGMQTHRSWWVAKQGLADTTKGDGKVTLKLKSGAEAPVSRTYLKAVKDAGWL
jgi:hypothetical protein